jgi:hypothetical protein
VVNIQNIFLGIISHHTSLKEASIIIGDILIFGSTVYKPSKYESNIDFKRSALVLLGTL